MGDVFYGNDDHREINDCIFKQDVMESMTTQRKSKDLKRSRQNKNCFNLRCFEFLTLLRAFVNF
uniref:Uncharacterized protein n=1 Tax=Cajanus cajan TaxID=3821 RepID=A0A151TM50_CAJCA|nr:hypothetical protein KK1_021725 [Cajanus cajan]